MIDQKHLDLLRELNTDSNPHSGGALLDHLRDTYEFLKSWGNPDHVCLAGLFHSIYGTQSYKTQSASFEDRKVIRNVIGQDSEQLAFLFCVIKRRTFFEKIGMSNPTLHDQIHDKEIDVTPEILRDLVEMEIANYMEFLPRLDFTREELDDFSGRVELAKNLISSAAHESITQAVQDKL